MNYFVVEEYRDAIQIINMKAVHLLLCLITLTAFGQPDTLPSFGIISEPIFWKGMDPQAQIYYYPYYNGVQIIEVDYYNRSLEEGRMEDMIHPRGGSSYHDAINFNARNGYLVRNEQGTILQNYGVDQSDIKRLLAPGSETRISHKWRMEQSRNRGWMNGIIYADEFGFVYHVLASEQGRYGGKVGLMDTLGNIVLPIEFDQITYVKGDYYVVKDGMWGMYDDFLQLRIPIIYNGITPVSKGIYLVRREGAYLVDRDNHFLNETRYNNIEVVPGKELLIYTIDSKYGLIDTLMNSITPPVYTWISRLDNDAFVASDTSRRMALIDPKGKQITDFKYSFEVPRYMGQGYYRVKGEYHDSTMSKGSSMQLLGLVDSTGKECLPTKYESIQLFNHNLILAMRHRKYGLVDVNDSIVLPFDFDKIYGFYEGRTVVEQNKLFGVIDTNGKFVLPVNYKQVSCSTEGRYVLRDINGKIGFIDIETGIASKFSYQNMGCFSHSMVRAYRDGKWGFLNAKGEEVTEFMFDEAYEFTELGYALIKIDGKFGAIDTTGKMVAQPIYSRINYTNDRRIILSEGKTKVVIPDK